MTRNLSDSIFLPFVLKDPEGPTRGGCVFKEEPFDGSGMEVTVVTEDPGAPPLFPFSLRPTPVGLAITTRAVVLEVYLVEQIRNVVSCSIHDNYEGTMSTSLFPYPVKTLNRVRVSSRPTPVLRLGMVYRRTLPHPRLVTSESEGFLRTGVERSSTFTV